MSGIGSFPFNQPGPADTRSKRYQWYSDRTLFFSCNYCFHFRSNFPEVYTFAAKHMGSRRRIYCVYPCFNGDLKNDHLIIPLNNKFFK